jgi:hypothetical protein
MEEVTSLLARPRLPDRARVMSAIDLNHMKLSMGAIVG